MPEFWCFPYKIVATICNDGIVVEFKRRIKGREDSIKISRRRSIKDVNPMFTCDENVIPVDGKNNIVIKDLAVTTTGCLQYLKPGGTLLTIPDNFGLFMVKSGGDVKMENVALFYVDKKGFPKQFTYKGVWIIASDIPSIFTVEAAKRRSIMEFVDSLVKSGTIKGEKMKRYTEADIASEIEEVKCEYQSIISSETVEEAEVQEFLEQHPFILSPLYLDISRRRIYIEPQKKFPKARRIVDFLLMQEPNLLECNIICTIIEIKRPGHRLFTRKGKMSKPLRGGIEQVNEVFKYVNLNLTEAKKFMPISDLSALRGAVIIGRIYELKPKDLKRLNEINMASPTIKVLTFDDLLKNIDDVKRVWGKRIRQPAVVVGQEGSEDEDFTGRTSETIQEAINFLSKRIERAKNR